MKRDADVLRNPPLLVEMEHPYAELIARGNREYETSPEETEHFCRMRAGRSPRSRREMTMLVPVAVAAVALIALALGVVARPAGISKSMTGSVPLPEAPTAPPPERVSRTI